MKIALVIAMDIEYEKMLATLGGKAEGTFARNDVILAHCGIGKVNAALGTFDLIERHHPDCIISTGLAGGVSEDVDVRDVVVASRTAYHDVWCGEPNQWGQVQGLPLYFESNEKLVRQAMSLADAAETTHRMFEGLNVTGDQFISDHDSIKTIHQAFPDALSCDMESAAIAHTCHRFGVPFLGIRIVSDTPGRVANHLEQWNEFIKHISDHSFRWLRQFLQSMEGFTI